MNLPRFEIDLNVRVRGDKTYAGFEDLQPGTVTYARPDHVPPELAVGQPVLVVEPEDAIIADGQIVEIDHERRFVYIAVDWHSFRDDDLHQTA